MTRDPWTPERILEHGLGPADVAKILEAEGWRIELAGPVPTSKRFARGAPSADPYPLCEVVAVKGDETRDLFDRSTSSRRREAKMLSEALGGSYAFTSGDGPGDWPPDWDMDRHNLTARLLAADGEAVEW